MYNVSNILSEYPKVANNFPSGTFLDAENFKIVQDNHDLYSDSDEIKNYIDEFVSELNKWASKSGSQSNIEQPKKVNVKRKAKKTEKVNKTKPEKKVKAKAKETKPVRNILTKLPDWLVTIRKAIRMSNKEYSQIALRNFLTFIKKSFDAKRAGATKTTHIEFIRIIQYNLVKSINSHINNKRIVFEIPNTHIDKMKEINKKYLVKIDRTSKVLRTGLKGIKKKAVQLL